LLRNNSNGNNSSSLSVKEDHLINIDNFNITDSPRGYLLRNPKENMSREHSSSFSWIEGIEKDTKKRLNSDVNINTFLKSIDKDKGNLSLESMESSDKSTSYRNYIPKNLIFNDKSLDKSTGHGFGMGSNLNVNTHNSKIQT
jgi:hypothetical protein